MRFLGLLLAAVLALAAPVQPRAPQGAPYVFIHDAGVTHRYIEFGNIPTFVNPARAFSPVPIQ